MADLLYVSDVSPYRPEPAGQGAAAGPTMAGVHHSLGSAAIALAEIAGLNGLGFRHATRAADVTADDLRAARLLALFTIGETPWNAEQRSVIEQRAAAGTLGIVGLHAATDAAYGWPAIGDLLGGRFNGHPITGDLPITVVDGDHPATAHLRSPWRFRDELYLFRELVPDARVLLAVEFGGTSVGRLPLAWCLERPPMRSFYTALGHFAAAYEDADYLQHVRGGIEWVLGGGGLPAAGETPARGQP
jgi:type 1 glutamine amidotransferase